MTCEIDEIIKSSDNKTKSLNDISFIESVTISENDKNNNGNVKKIPTRRCCSCKLCAIIWGVFLCVFGLILIKYKLFDILMTEKLKMEPGFPPFDWWIDPEPEIRCKIYIFTATNPHEFLNNSNTKLKFKEIGPITYRERIQHKDVVFHRNSTMSYTISRWLEYLPDSNEPGIINMTIIVPNIVLLGMAASINEASIGIKLPFNMISRYDNLFINTTVYNYLWNLTTPALVSLEKIVPFMIQQPNGGALHNIYAKFKDRVNVKIGKKYGFDNFFFINTFNGRTTVPGFKPESGDCYATIENSTEGAYYPSFITKKSILNYWRKSVCRPILLKFEKEIHKGSILSYKFNADVSMFDRFPDLEKDCYKNLGNKILPNGLSDMSKCYNDIPIVASLPHFYGRRGFWDDQLEGFTSSKEKHESYTVVEPITGIPVEQKARSQSNMLLPKFNLFSKKFDRFNNMIIPMTWIEYNQEKLTPNITNMIIFIVKFLPILQYLFPIAFLISGLGFICIGVRNYFSSKKPVEKFYTTENNNKKG